MRNQNGITLIALVITIIVLLILAGVTIAMLSGENGILTNANKANCENAYYSAQEQMGLAYMSVRTEIMSQKVANSSYDAQEYKAATETTEKVDHAQDLADIVDNELGSEYTIKPATDHKAIYIQYKNTAITKDLIKSGTPKTNTYVYGKITLDKQSASFDYDVGKPSGSGAPEFTE